MGEARPPSVEFFARWGSGPGPHRKVLPSGPGPVPQGEVLHGGERGPIPITKFFCPAEAGPAFPITNFCPVGESPPS